jgi:nitrite reductase/ring-hydroxylating ferredoxin subunit
MGEDFVKVAETKNIDASQMMAVAVNGEKMGPSNAKGKHYAIGNVCTHMGGGSSYGRKTRGAYSSYDQLCQTIIKQQVYSSRSRP